MWAKYICNLAKLVSLKCVKFTLACHWFHYWTSPVRSSLYLYIPFRVRCQATLCGTWGWTKWHWDRFLPLGHRSWLGNIVPPMLRTHSCVYHRRCKCAILSVDSVVICLGLCLMYVCSPNVLVTYFDKNVCISRRYRSCCMPHPAIHITLNEEREWIVSLTYSFIHLLQLLKSRCDIFSTDWWRTCICPSFDEVSELHVVLLECCITFGKSKILVIHWNIFTWQGDVRGRGGVVASCVKFDLYESWKTVRKCSGPILKHRLISERPKRHHEGSLEISTCKIYLVLPQIQGYS